MKQQPVNTSIRGLYFFKLGVFGVALFALSMGLVMAQSGGNKDTKKLRDKVEKARESVQDAEKEVKGTMEVYNSILEQTAKKPESAYKKLTSALEDCDKAAKSARKNVDSLKADLEKFYATWEAEIESYASESMKAYGQKGLDEVRGKFERFNSSLEEASQLYRPFITTLQDQALVLGRDLSPEMLKALEGESRKLNEGAEALYAKIDEALNDTRADNVEATPPAGEAEAMEPEATEDEAETTESGTDDPAASDAGSEGSAGDEY